MCSENRRGDERPLVIFIYHRTLHAAHTQDTRRREEERAVGIEGTRARAMVDLWVARKKKTSKAAVFVQVLGRGSQPRHTHPCPPHMVECVLTGTCVHDGRVFLVATRAGQLPFHVSVPRNRLVEDENQRSKPMFESGTIGPLVHCLHCFHIASILLPYCFHGGQGVSV